MKPGGIFYKRQIVDGTSLVLNKGRPGIAKIQQNRIRVFSQKKGQMKLLPKVTIEVSGSKNMLLELVINQLSISRN